jgi:hypothetical protein
MIGDALEGYVLLNEEAGTALNARMIACVFGRELSFLGFEAQQWLVERLVAAGVAEESGPPEAPVRFRRTAELPEFRRAVEAAFSAWALGAK